MRNKTTSDFLKNIRFIPAARYQLSGGSTTQASTTNSPVDPAVDGLVFKALVLLSAQIPPAISEFYESLGVNKRKGSSLLKKIVNSGYGMEHQYHPRRPGGAIKIIELTSMAWSQLKQFGIETPNQVIQGSWIHNLTAVVLAEIGKRQGYRVVYETPIGMTQNVRIDEIWRNNDGKQIFWQCGVSSPEREADAAARTVKLSELETYAYWLVCKDKSFAQKVERHIRNTPAEKNINVMLIGDVLESYYNKQTIEC